ncbi:MAG: hypothetical protein WD035_05115 [Balneolaceae bacterium]
MGESGACLGFCFNDHQLYYAVNDLNRDNQLDHIGCIEFSFPLKKALFGKPGSMFEGIESTLTNLSKKYSCQSARMLTPATEECWTTFPRLVYETPDEREDHLSVLMEGIPREQLETTWFGLSNQDYRLLLIRNKNKFNGFRKLLHNYSSSDFVSEFEIGIEWHKLTGITGSYLTINCHPGYLAVSSFLFGKLRGATRIPFETLHDLPYLWNFYGNHVEWMKGIHEQVYVFGDLGMQVMEIMSGYFQETGEAILMNSLKSMRMNADENTYGFPLESAFPAILLSLNFDKNRDP